MATWGDQTCQRFEATAVGFETGFSRLRVRPSNRYAIVPHNYKLKSLELELATRKNDLYGDRELYLHVVFTVKTSALERSTLPTPLC